MRIVLGDITKMDTDAIVNTAVSDLSPCPGICSAIFAAADTEELKKACRKIGRCRIGHAMVTPSCGLPSKIIIHVAGAGWYGGVQRERMLLEECYRRALQKALLYNCRTVAVPLIFSGDCHMPRAESIRIAGKVIREFEVRHPDIEVTLVLYQEGVYEMARRLLAQDKPDSTEADVGRSVTVKSFGGNRKIFRRIKRPPSQRTGNEMAVGIFIMVLDFCITGVRSPGGKIPPKPHPSGSAPVRCSGAKPGSGKGPGHSPLQFQSDCRSQRWTERRPGCWKRASSSGL